MVSGPDRPTDATSKQVTIRNVWDGVDYSKPRNRVKLAEEPHDLLIATHSYAPGQGNEMHFQVGTGQSLRVLKGVLVIRHRHKDLPREQTEESTLKEGDSVMIPADVYFALNNPGPDPVLFYQVKQPGDLVEVEGKGVFKQSDYFGPGGPDRA